MSSPRERWARGGVVALSTIAVIALALVWPALARGEAWWSAKWTAWPGPLAPHPSTADAIGWLARAGWCGVLAAGVLAVPYVIWRMTLGADARVPRLGLPTILPLSVGPRGWRTRVRDAPGVLRGGAVLLAVLALGRPQSVLRGDMQEEKGIDIVLVLDLSGSMAAVMDAPAADLVPGSGVRINRHRATRIDVAKDVLIDFVKRRKTDRIGVVVFAKQAFVLSPPTLDYALIASLVSKIELNVIDSSKTAIGDAVGNGDDVDVQAGTDLFGQPVYARRRFPVNPALLKSMSHETGGESFIATDRSGLENSMHSILDHLEKTKFESEASTMEDLFPFLLVPAVVLIALEALVRLALVRRFP